jgi:glutathione S-transferase
MLTLYYAKNSCAFAPHVILEDANAEYVAIKIDFQKAEQFSDHYTNLNIKQRVPTLVTGSGILTETPAIMSYIANQHPKMNLLPSDPFTNAKAQSFNCYLSSTVHVAHAHKHRGKRWANDKKALDNMTANVKQNMTACGELIEKNFLKGPWVLGEQYTICDPYLAVITRWLDDDGVDLTKFPKIMEHNKNIRQRQSMKKVMEIHNS